MAKRKDDKPKPVMLGEVKITASRLAKPNTKTRLYPKGEANTKSIDSLKSINPKLGKLIGNPIVRKGEVPQYGANSSDIIKKALAPKKVKPDLVAKLKKK